MKVLIIGGSGLISTNITRRLLERGDDVTVYNRGKTEQWVSGDFKQVKGDRTNYPLFEQQIAELGAFDCAIDMVCYEPDEARSAVRALRGRVGQYIFCSTVDVYGKPPASYPILENASRDNPLGDYARKKAICEEIIFKAQEQNTLRSTIIRPAYTYGEGRGIIHSFGWKTTYEDRIRKGKPIIVHGDGNSLWVSCHCDDVASAFVGAVGNPKALGRAYHVPGEEWLTWNQMHRQVAEVLGAPEPTLVHIPSTLLTKAAGKYAGVCEINFQFNNIFDTTAAREELGFRYTVAWKEGVRRVVAWLDAHQRIENSDDDSTDDRVIAAWERLSEQMTRELSQ